MRLFCSLLLLLLLFATTAYAAPNVFNQDVQLCSGRPWIDVTCNGADPTGAADSTTAISNTINTAVSNDWPIFFPAGDYKVSSKITVEYGGQANNGPQIISQGATIDGRTIASGNVLQIQCSGGTTASPVVCNHLQISGWLSVVGSGAGYVVVLGNTDFSDRQNAVRIEHLVATNNGTGGAIQANYLTDGDLWLSGSTVGGSSSVGAVALEQVQTSRISGYGSALGASAPALLIENGSSMGDNFVGFAYDQNSSACISITAGNATRNVWLAPYFSCALAINAPTNANQNLLIGPTFAATTTGPLSSGIAVVGRGSLNRFAAPATAALTLYGADDGTIFSSANATGPGTPFAAASLPVTLPDPTKVGAGWIAGFVSDNSRAVTLSATAGQILANNRQLSSLTVGGSGSATNFEVAVLESDGSNYRLLYASQGTALLNGLQTAWPARWYYPGGSGYQATLGDNGGVISSGQTAGGLTVTLPSITGLPIGWMVAGAADANHLLTFVTNGTNGGSIIGLGGNPSTVLNVPVGAVKWLQFDGASFRLVVESGTYESCPSITNWGGLADGSTDNSAALSQAIAVSPCVYFPHGVYKFVAPLSVSIATSLTIKGDGPTSIMLQSGATSGWTLTMTSDTGSLHVRDLAFQTDTVNLVTAVTIARHDPQENLWTSDFTGVEFSGFGGLASPNYYKIGVSILNQSFVYFVSDSFIGLPTLPASGIGVVVAADRLTPPGAGYNFVNTNFQALLEGISMKDFAQGIEIVNGNFSTVGYGIIVPPTASSTFRDHLSITNSHIGVQGGGVGVYIQGNDLSDVLISNNYFLLEGGAAAAMVTNSVVGNASFRDNIIRSSAGTNTGVVLIPGGPNGVEPIAVQNNTFLADNDLMYAVDYQAHTNIAYTNNVIAVHGGGAGTVSPAVNVPSGQQITFTKVDGNTSVHYFYGLPETCTGLASGALYNNAGVLTLCP